MAIDSKRVKEIFLEAAELPDEAARGSFLDRACGGDVGLRARVDVLLRSHDLSGSFLGTPTSVMPDPDHAGTMAIDSSDRDGGLPSPDHDDESDDLSFLSPSTRPDSLGRLGHYEVLQVLGKGGFGIVFRAFDDMLQRVVAVKVMAPQIATLSPARKRFLREARSSAAVRHENVVQVHEVGEQPLPYLAMEFIPGETLQQKLDRSGPVDVSEVLRIGRQIAEGLAAAHACDLIHRDIKPGNILIEGGSQKVKITDFGLARAADDASISQSGVIAGTPMFMSPEQALGHQIDQRADLFSLGSVLYQMASGRPPFRAPSTLAVLKRVAEEPPRRIQEIIPETPDWLCGTIAKLHAKNPNDRFQSAREVADLLADCEAKLKAKQEVKNVLPAVVKPPAPTGSAGRKWVAATAILLLPVIALAVTELAGVTHLFRGQQATNYSRNLGELEILPGEGLQSVIVLQNDKGVVDGELHPRVTDWLDMTNPHTLTVPPGKYQLNVGTWPEGSSVREWEVTTSGPFGSTQVWLPVVNTSAIITVERGQRVTLRPKMRLDPIKPGVEPKPVPVVKQEPLPTKFKNSFGMEFVIVPKGKSWLGWEYLSKEPMREVNISQDFYLGKYEVTQEEWQKVMGKNPSHFTRERVGREVADDELKRFPVETVSWDDATEFVKLVNEKVKQDAIEAGWEYRLPTELEWEYACRGGPMADKSEGEFDYYREKPSKTLSRNWDEANFGSDRPKKVGSYPPNRLGLHDMHGNVWEWCENQIDPKDSPLQQVIRGGSWGGISGPGPAMCRAARRYPNLPTLRANIIGLRLARVPSLTKFTNSLGMKFALVPKGKSWLGGGGGKPGTTEVNVTQDFYLGTYEVTQEEWQKIMGNNPSYFTRERVDKNIGDDELKRFPVELVSWDDAKHFVKLVNDRVKNDAPEAGWEYRLPTQEQWEYACRGGPMTDKAESAFDYYFEKPSKSLSADQANFNENLKRPSKVGSYPPNRLGLYDMHGNVWEWCEDWIDPEYARLVRPSGKGLDRVARGGSWGMDADNSKAMYPYLHPASFRFRDLGLRLARVPLAAK